MIKPLIILFNTVSVFLFSFFFGDTPVTVSGNFPKSAKVATEFTAEIKVNKGNIGGFAKLQLEVPQGFTVKELDSKTGNFSFAGNIAKIIWTSMPSDQEFIVKFTFSADASASGAKTIASKFSFVNNNNKEVVEMAPAEIIIGDGNSENPITSTSTSSTETTTTQTAASNTTSPTPSFENPAEPNSNIICQRTITNGTNANEYNVDVKIKKGNIKGFAKYQEVLPTGFIAKAGKTNGSSFSLADGKLKFVWVSLPTEEELQVSYVLEKSATAATDAKLDNGEFSYLENDQSKKVKIQTESIGNPIGEVAKTETPVVTQTISSEAAAPSTTQVASKEPVKNENTSSEPTKTESPKSEPQETITKKEGNVIYNVQIGAFRNAIQSNILSKKFNISETIKSEMTEGFNKFMVGNFNEYKQARSHREDIKQKGCNSAFVVAYNGAKRITVQEALMITSQKWFK